MSGHDNERLEQRDKRGKGKQLQLPWDVGEEAPGSEKWEDVEAYLIAYVVQAVGGAGGSVQFTTARDNGALGVRVYDDDIETKTAWAKTGGELEELLYRIGDYYRRKAGKETQRWS